MTTMAALKTQTKWLSLIGIGEDGMGGLSPAARTLLAQAQFVIGGARHLALVGPLAAPSMAWPSPLHDALPEIVARRGTPLAVLASGDPFFYGIGALLTRHVPTEEIICLPAPSSFSLAAARLGWPLQECRLVSLHGREFTRIVPHLQPGARILCLSWDETTPPRLAAFLCERGFGASQITVMEAMGGARERLCTLRAADFALSDIDPLNLVALDIVAEATAKILPLGTGLADEWFESDGQLTKREIRALTLAALRPQRGARLWDIGAGAGSVGIEWLLLDPLNQAIAIEANPERAARIARNATALGVPHLEIVTGKAPEALKALPPPHAIFIGGGASDPGIIDAAFAALPSGGRLVVNAVTLETQALLLRCFETHSGDLVQAQISRADRVGGFHAWRPAMPVMQWAWTKP